MQAKGLRSHAGAGHSRLARQEGRKMRRSLAIFVALKPYNAVRTTVLPLAISRIPAVALFAAAVLLGADKKLPIEETSNDKLDISASAILDKDQIKQELGSDLGGDIAVVRVTLRSVSEKPIQVSLDDFLLVSSKDGQRSQPYAPGQIAGADSLTVTPTGVKKAARARPSFGGMVGLGGGGIGNSGASPTPDLKVEATHDETENPLLAVLNAKILPEKEITETISGLLYFQMVGKVKPKDLELHYKGPAGAMALRFKP